MVVVSAGEENYYFASVSPDVVTTNPEAIDTRLRDFPGADRFREAVVLDYAPERIRQLNDRVVDVGRVLGNRDDQPTGYAYGTLLWEQFSGDGSGGTSWLRRAFEKTQSVGAGSILLGILLSAVLWAALGQRRQRSRIDTGLSVLVSGGTAMAVNLVLLLHYQSVCGALYERLGMMSALFMLGVATGAAMLGRIAPRVARPAILLVGVLVSLAIFTLGLTPVLSFLSARVGVLQQLGYGGLFVAIGVGLGASFPAAAQVLLSAAQPVGSAREEPMAFAGGLMDAMDHLGAMLGALVTGSLLLPAFGSMTTLSLLAASSAAMSGVWLVRIMRP